MSTLHQTTLGVGALVPERGKWSYRKNPPQERTAPVLALDRIIVAGRYVEVRIYRFSVPRPKRSVRRHHTAFGKLTSAEMRDHVEVRRYD